jgi:hypothetical protein
MQILTLKDETFYLNDLPEEVDDDCRFAVLDNSNPLDPDYFFQPLIFLESFTSPAAVLQIGPYEIQMPLDWCMVVGDPECTSECEVMPLTNLNDRGFRAFTFNPISGFKPEFFPVDITNIYQDVKWYFPKMRMGQILATPLHSGPKPICAYFVKEISRQSEILDYSKCW